MNSYNELPSRGKTNFPSNVRQRREEGAAEGRAGAGPLLPEEQRLLGLARGRVVPVERASSRTRYSLPPLLPSNHSPPLPSLPPTIPPSLSRALSFQPSLLHSLVLSLLPTLAPSPTSFSPTLLPICSLVASLLLSHPPSPPFTAYFNSLTPLRSSTSLHLPSSLPLCLPAAVPSLSRFLPALAPSLLLPSLLPSFPPSSTPLLYPRLPSLSPPRSHSSSYSAPLPPTHAKSPPPIHTSIPPSQEQILSPPAWHQSPCAELHSLAPNRVEKPTSTDRKGERKGGHAPCRVEEGGGWGGG